MNKQIEPEYLDIGDITEKFQYIVGNASFFKNEKRRSAKCK